MKLSYIIEELLSPIVTPFILIFKLRYRSAEIVDFLRTSTVDVQGVGDVCSLAQLDLKMASQTSDETNFDRSSKFLFLLLQQVYLFYFSSTIITKDRVITSKFFCSTSKLATSIKRSSTVIRPYQEQGLSIFCDHFVTILCHQYLSPILLIILDSGNVPEWTNFTKSKSSTRPNVEFIAAWCLPSITSGTKHASDLTRKLSAVIY